jgi:hypothetical protein
VPCTYEVANFFKNKQSSQHCADSGDGIQFFHFESNLTANGVLHLKENMKKNWSMGLFPWVYGKG